MAQFEPSEISDGTAADLRGYIDAVIAPNIVRGWVFDNLDVERGGITVRAFLNDNEIARGEAVEYRNDLVQFGSGKFGFNLFFPEEIPYGALLYDLVKIEVFHANQTIGSLHIDYGIKTSLRILLCAKLLEELKEVDSRFLEIHLTINTPRISQAASDALAASLNALKADQSKLPLYMAPDIASVSAVNFKVGIRSPDLVAVLGREGYLFLIGGSNNVEEKFAASFGDQIAEATATNWIDVIERRKTFADTIGAQFIQTIIPEKLSVVRELYDGRSSSPTAILYAFERMIRTSFLKKNYVSGLSSAQRIPLGAPFRKIDSHYSPAGAHALFVDICSRLDFLVNENVVFNLPILLDGDLARRIFGHELYEVGLASAEPKFRHSTEVIDDFVPSSGYRGRRFVFRNTDAPIKKRVLAFANSFFDNPSFQGSVSYWFATWFSEYHFIFSPDIDMNYATALKPDILICQTVERFLSELPAS